MRFLCSKILHTNDFILSKIDGLKIENHQKIYKMKDLILNNIFEQQREIQAKKRILESYNPQNILSKGYALVSGKLAAGEEIMIQTIDKKITAEVKNVERN